MLVRRNDRRIIRPTICVLDVHGKNDRVLAVMTAERMSSVIITFSPGHFLVLTIILIENSAVFAPTLRTHFPYFSLDPYGSRMDAHGNIVIIVSVVMNFKLNLIIASIFFFFSDFVLFGKVFFVYFTRFCC